MLLFAMTGLGNGSTFRQIPVIFLDIHQQRVSRGEVDEEQAVRDANKESAAVVGFTGAFAAFGGFFIPKSYGTSIDLTGHVTAALYCFIAFYAMCCVINWWYYLRKNAEVKC
jgi:nitrite extrusion protein